MIADIVTELEYAHQQDRDPWDATLYRRAADEIERLRAERNEWRCVVTLFGDAFAIDEFGQFVPSDGSDVIRAVLAYEEARRV